MPVGQDMFELLRIIVDSDCPQSIAQLNELQTLFYSVTGEKADNQVNYFLNTWRSQKCHFKFD
jgi:hypothetical protein